MDVLGSWLRDLADWSLAVVKHWVPLVTGGLITAILVVVNLTQQQPLTWPTWIWLYAAVLYASFLAWKEGAHGRPKFSAYIKRLAFFDGAAGRPGAWLVGRAFVANHGTKCTIHDLEVWASIRGTRTRGEITTIGRDYALTDPTRHDDSRQLIWAAHDIRNTRQMQFEKGHGDDYQFFAFFPGQSRDELALTSVEICFKDAFEGAHKTAGDPRLIDPGVWSITPV